jgi:hypothetical protein
MPHKHDSSLRIRLNRPTEADLGGLGAVLLALLADIPSLVRSSAHNESELRNA